MSFLDRVTQAVGETLEAGKKEMDLFLRSQKIKGEIDTVETTIRGLDETIQRTKQAMADRVLVMLRDGTLTAAELQEFPETIKRVEGEIAAQRAVVAEKQTALARIKAGAATTGQPSSAPPAAEASVPPPDSAGETDRPQASAGVCPRCGAPRAPHGAFCPACGATCG